MEVTNGLRRKLLEIMELAQEAQGEWCSIADIHAAPDTIRILRTIEHALDEILFHVGRA